MHSYPIPRLLKNDTFRLLFRFPREFCITILITGYDDLRLCSMPLKFFGISNFFETPALGLIREIAFPTKIHLG